MDVELPQDVQENQQKASECIREAQEASNARVIHEKLVQVQEIVLNACPSILPQFASTFMEFRSAPAANDKLRKLIAGFAGSVAMIPDNVQVTHDAVVCLADLAEVAPRQGVVPAATKCYRFLLQILNDLQESTLTVNLWTQLERLREKILALLDHSAAIVVTQSVKFAETVMLAFTSPSISVAPEKAFNTSQLAALHFCLKADALQSDAEAILKNLCERLAKKGQKSLGSIVDTLTNVSKSRPQLMPTTIPPLIASARDAKDTTTRNRLKKSLLELLSAPFIENGPFRDDMVKVLSDNLGAENEAKSAFRVVQQKVPFKDVKEVDFGWGGVSQTAPPSSVISDLGLLSTLLTSKVAPPSRASRDPRQRSRDPRLIVPELPSSVEDKAEVKPKPETPFMRRQSLLKVLLRNVQQARMAACEAGAVDVWENAVARLGGIAAGIGSVSSRLNGQPFLTDLDTVKESLADIAGDLAESELAVLIRFLHIVYVTNEADLYETAVRSMVDRRMELDAVHDSWADLSLQVPKLTDSLKSAIAQLASQEAEKDVVLPGQQALISIILHRPIDRGWALDALCEIATAPSSQEHRVAALLILTRMLYATQAIVNVVKGIEERAEALFRQAGHEDDADTARRLMMPFLLLCASNHDLLLTLRQLYPDLSPHAKGVLHGELPAIVQTVGASSPAIVALVKDIDRAAVPMLLQVLHVLTENEPPPPDLSDAIHELYSKTMDARLLVSVAHSLKDEDVVSLLSLDERITAVALGRIIRNDSLKPADLLVLLHMESKGVHIKRQIQAINVCFAEEHRAKFSREVLASVLRRLINMNPLPRLLLRTMILVHQVERKELTPFIIDMLSQLIRRSIWKNSDLWEGFIRLCMNTLPKSYSILLQLPQPQLDHVVQNASKYAPQKVMDLRKQLVNYATRHQHTLSLAPEVSRYLFPVSQSAIVSPKVETSETPDKKRKREEETE